MSRASSEPINLRAMEKSIKEIVHLIISETCTHWICADKKELNRVETELEQKIKDLVSSELAKANAEKSASNCNLDVVTACACSVDETTGWTTVKCCNICGRPLKDQNWHWR